VTYANHNPTTGLDWEATTRGRHAIAAERLAKLQARLAKRHANPEPEPGPAVAATPPPAEPAAEPAAPPAPFGDELLRTSEAARRLQVSQRGVLTWAASGRLPSILTPGGHRRFRASDVERVRAAMWKGEQP
jgi:excisionase family DNA binding protein